MLTDEELIARLDNLYNMLEEEGNYTKANTAAFAKDRIEQLIATNEALTAERDMWITQAKHAIWADSEELKEAEDYAEELEKELNTCRMAHAVMDNTVADLEAKLTKAVKVLNALDATLDRNGWHFASIAREGIRDTLAEIKGENRE